MTLLLPDGLPNLDAQLSPHFSLRELAVTTHREYLDENVRTAATRFGLPLFALCRTLLEPIRTHFGRPVIVHSGFRCPALNRAIGGVTASQHTKGEAADFHVAGVGLEDVWTWIWKTSGLPYGQCLLEGRAGAGAWGWVHLSLGEPWRPTDRCRQRGRIKVPS